jgi:hypothetical protein
MNAQRVLVAIFSAQEEIICSKDFRSCAPSPRRTLLRAQHLLKRAAVSQTKYEQALLESRIRALTYVEHFVCIDLIFS